VQFDGKEYCHPLGGVVRWTRIDERSWEMTLTQDEKLIGHVIYRLSDEGGRYPRDVVCLEGARNA
jgi:hypothetical protein